jgi:DNA-binding HxlR family transcriptional regulator
MRSYGQYCAMAKALDVIGDRWTLLIVRELMVLGACRYTDIREGLPGIATNLLAERLRELEAAGIVARREAPPPIATALYELTARGRQLEPLLDELGSWGLQYMSAGPAPGDQFRSRWLTWPAQQFLTDHQPQEPPVSIEAQVGEDSIVIETAPEGVRARPGTAEHPDATLSGAPHALLALLSGQLDLAAARAKGVQYSGSPAVLRRLQPLAFPASRPAAAS